MNAIHQLSNGMEFTPYPRKQPFNDNSKYPYKTLAKDVPNVLANPMECRQVQARQGKIYLGDGTNKPGEPKRYPMYVPAELFSSHVLIAGGIGSGKTSLVFRVVPGALLNYGSVVISEAKAGKNGGEEGAAFTDLAKYLGQKFPQLQVYRWPRGNCWFNPLNYLKSSQNRRAFLDALCNQIETYTSVSGDMIGFIYNAANIAEQLIAYLQEFSPETLILRRLVTFLKFPVTLGEELKSQMENCYQQLQTLSLGEEEERVQEDFRRLQEIHHQLKMLNFFYLEQPEFTMTRHGVNLFANLFDHEDLLYYSEPHANLPELQIDEILYNWALVIVSQPLYDPASRVAGPLFWDSLLARVIELGPNPELKDGKPRQKVLAVLDETHRLPVGRLGESGDFLREYNLGLVEITPTIVDERRWMQNQHIYQTLISLSPGVPPVVELMQSRLPNFFIKPGYVTPSIDAQGQPQSTLNLIPNYQYLLSQDNPGVSARSLQMTGRYTALLQSLALDGQGKVFWIDLENELLGQIKRLLKEALAPDCPADIHRAVDYALGLAEFYC